MRIGCAAHDIIQWFAVDDYKSSPLQKIPAEKVWKVDFPRAFDLLDVLAICYSIQRTQSCSVYTIQRYNCYFLCLTILAVLARRVGGWEKIIDSGATWSRVVTEAIDQLRHTACEEMDEYGGLGLGFCHILDPDHPTPRDFILNPIYSQLCEKALESWPPAISTSLWTMDLASATRERFGTHVKTAVDRSLQSDDAQATKMRFALLFNLENEKDWTKHNIPSEFGEAVIQGSLPVVYDTLGDITRYAKAIYTAHGMEYTPTLKSHLRAWGLAFYGIFILLLKGERVARETSGRQGVANWSVQ
ncbi:unnamed protein product [Rhizoctonia solani]|uniref:Uncharacterized protein n=1 Tax=Rhizoctonia solani TaxID=456999 RepID=A0A8H3A031_9AGAM|nr:unnamed protein product [Rhizoctonia solani]